MVQILGPETVYIISFVGRRMEQHYNQQLVVVCRGTGLRPDHCKFLRDKTGPGGKGKHAIRLEITEVIDDQLEVLQDVRRAFLAAAERDTPRLWLIPRAYLNGRPNSRTTRRQTSTAPGCTYACNLSVIHDALAMPQWRATGAPGKLNI